MEEGHRSKEGKDKWYTIIIIITVIITVTNLHAAENEILLEALFENRTGSFRRRHSLTAKNKEDHHCCSFRIASRLSCRQDPIAEEEGEAPNNTSIVTDRFGGFDSAAAAAILQQKEAGQRPQSEQAQQSLGLRWWWCWSWS